MNDTTSIFSAIIEYKTINEHSYAIELDWKLGEQEAVGEPWQQYGWLYTPCQTNHL